MLNQGITRRHSVVRVNQLLPADAMSGGSLDAAAKAEIDRILGGTIVKPIGPEFMTPPAGGIVA
jgi:hypothetical protein